MNTISTPGNGFETEPPTPVTQAQQAISFAFDPQLVELPVQPEAADVLRRELQDLKSTNNPESALNWQDSTHINDPSVPQARAFGIVTYDDGSRLIATISNNLATPPKSEGLFNRDDLVYLALSTSENDKAEHMWRAEYTVPRDGGALLCETDQDRGRKIQAAMDGLEHIDVEDFSEDQLWDTLGGVLVESAMLAEGLDPELDSDIVELREADEDYRAISDHARNEILNDQLEREIGIQPGKRPASVDEARKLIELLSSL